jgi:uncharacterized membrane protein
MDAPTSIHASRLWSIALLASGGLILSASLAAISLSASGRPPGCGPGSGCEQVLASRWGGIGPIPTGVFAGAAYAALLACLVTTRKPRAARRAWTLAAVISVGILAAAAWFIVLQVAVIRAICLYCLADHALGAGAAVLVLATVFSRRRPLAPWTLVITSGVLTIAGLIGLQLLIPHHSAIGASSIPAQ